MTDILYNQDKVTRYYEAATELHNLRVEVGQRIEAAIDAGNNQEARSALEELQASGEKFQELRSTLTARDLFVAKYNIEVHGRHEVSFVLPKGVSRYEMLSEAQGLVDDRVLVCPYQLKDWQKNPAFEKRCDVPERIHVDGHVQGGDAKDRATQEALVKSRGLTLPSLEDLAAAFVAHYVATGMDIFQDQVVRAAGGALHFLGIHLTVNHLFPDSGSWKCGVAALVPRNSKN